MYVKYQANLDEATTYLMVSLLFLLAHGLDQWVISLEFKLIISHNQSSNIILVFKFNLKAEVVQ